MFNRIAKSKYTKILLGSRRGRSFRTVSQYFRSSPQAGYVGFLGYGNVGDEMLFDSIQQLFGDIDLISSNSQLPIEMIIHNMVYSNENKCIILGGGTLVFNDFYLKWLEDALDKGQPLIIFGTGVRDIDFWHSADWGKDSIIDIDRWVGILNAASYIGVRGPRSYKSLLDVGVKNVNEIGDPALFYSPSAEISKFVEISKSRRLIVNLGANGPISGEMDSINKAVLESVKILISEGWEAIIVPFHKTDLIIANNFATLIGRESIKVWENYLDVKATIKLVQSGDLVLCQRLHCAVAVASVGKVPIALAYRPKVYDFMESMGVPQFALSTENLSSDKIINACRDIENNKHQYSSLILERKELYRKKTYSAIDDIRSLIKN